MPKPVGVKNEQPPRNKSAAPGPAAAPAPQSGDAQVTEGNIEWFESQTIEKVNKTITILEGSLATWDASKGKPADLSERFDKYRKLHDALVDWETRILRSRSKQERLSFESRLQRLREFIEICYANA